MTEEHDMLINEQQAAEMMGLSPATLRGWRYKGEGPRFIKINARCIRYRLRDIRAWVDSRELQSTSEHVKKPSYDQEPVPSCSG